MSEQVMVESGGTTFWVEVAEGSGVSTVSLDTAMSFDGVADAVTEIGRSLSAAWDAVKPDEASVEFGLKVTAKTGKLTGLLVEGGGEAALKVTLSWKATPTKADATSS